MVFRRYAVGWATTLIVPTSIETSGNLKGSWQTNKPQAEEISSLSWRLCILYADELYH